MPGIWCCSNPPLLAKNREIFVQQLVFEQCDHFQISQQNLFLHVKQNLFHCLIKKSNDQLMKL